MVEQKPNLALPLDGEYHDPTELKHSDVIIFVHFFGGNKQNLKRHVQLVNDLGYRAVTFNLTFDPKYYIKKIPVSLLRQWGLKHVWADEIERVLNSVRGQKILYTLSNPSACAIEAIARRNAHDVRGLICDSGPFLHLWSCNWNFLREEFKIKNPIKQTLFNVLMCGLWSLEHEGSLKKDLKSLPKNFPVLSIRGGKDPLVPPSAIADVFNDLRNIQLEVLDLPNATHLNGLKDFANEYIPRVTNFLKKVTRD